MSIEYRISPTDKRNIEWRARDTAPWTLYATRDSVQEARTTLQRIERGTWYEEDKDAA